MTENNKMIQSVPSAQQMLKWLRSDAVVQQDGGILSWDNPEHPGHRCPEAAGFLLALLAQEEPAGRLHEQMVRALAGDVTPAGGVGCGDEYLFDTAVALSGIIAHERAGGRLPDPAMPSRLFGFLTELLGARRGRRMPERRQPHHWSSAFGCHLLKVVQALQDYSDRDCDPRCVVLTESLVSEMLPLYRDGRFRIHRDSEESYAHAHCYALEGVCSLARRGRSDLCEIQWAGALWLARIQDQRGGIRAWHDGERSYGDFRADATAQAIRIWAYLDRRGFDDEIARGLSFLAQLQSAGGGLCYQPGCGDVNTWATIFAVQAARWVSEGAGDSAFV